MTINEIIKIITDNECYLKETFFTNRNVYEIVNRNNIRICTITYNQYTKIQSLYKTTLYKEDYNGFTKRWHKIEKR